MKSNIPCALCNCSDISIVSNYDRHNNPLRSVICNTCGLVWIDPRPSEKEVRQFYASEYRKSYKGSDEPKTKHCYRETKRAVNRLGIIAKYFHVNDKLLDIGTGGGFFAYIMLKNGICIDGIEPNTGYAEFAVNTLKLKNIHKCYLEDYKEANYNIITINHVFEHLPDPNKSLSKIHELLADKGILIIEVPNIMATYRAPNKVFHLGHLYWYSPNTLNVLVLKSGFKIIETIIKKNTKHISLVLQKSTKNTDPVKLPESSEVFNFLKSRSAFKHYCTYKPYTRFISKLAQYLIEYIYISRFKSKIDVIESIDIPILIKQDTYR